MVRYILFGVIVLLFGIIYIVRVKIQAKGIVESQPRVPMFECPEHGLIMEEHLIHHLGQKVCPRCFDKRVKMAKLDLTV